MHSRFAGEREVAARQDRKATEQERADGEGVAGCGLG